MSSCHQIGTTDGLGSGPAKVAARQSCHNKRRQCRRSSHRPMTQTLVVQNSPIPVRSGSYHPIGPRRALFRLAVRRSSTPVLLRRDPNRASSVVALGAGSSCTNASGKAAPCRNGRQRSVWVASWVAGSSAGDGTTRRAGRATLREQAVDGVVIASKGRDFCKRVPLGERGRHKMAARAV